MDDAKRQDDCKDQVSDGRYAGNLIGVAVEVAVDQCNGHPDGCEVPECAGGMAEFESGPAFAGERP